MLYPKVVPNDFIDPVAATKIVSPKSNIGKNTFKGQLNLCKKLSIAYICLFSIMTIYIVLTCVILAINNMFYKKIVYQNYDFYVLMPSDLVTVLVIPVAIIFGISILVINIFLMMFTSGLSIEYPKLKKLSNTFLVGIFLGIPSYITSFILLLKIRKIKTIKLENK